MNTNKIIRIILANGKGVGIKRGYGCGWEKTDEKRRMEDKTRIRKCGWRIKRG